MVTYEIIWPIEVDFDSDAGKYNDLSATLVDCIRQLYELAQDGQEVPPAMTLEELQLFAAENNVV